MYPHLLLDYVYREDKDQLRKDGLIPNVPTQPMGYEDAKNFLMLLDGTNPVPKDWEGKITGLTYRVGGKISGGRLEIGQLLKCTYLNCMNESRVKSINIYLGQ